MIVVTLPVRDGLPVVGGSELTKREGSSGWVSVHFAPVNKYWVMLYDIGGGNFLAIPSDDALLTRLPAGTQWETYKTTAAIRSWKWWHVYGSDEDGSVRGRVVRTETDVPSREASEEEPWALEGVTATSAVATLPSICGQATPSKFRRETLGTNGEKYPPDQDAKEVTRVSR